MEVKIQLCLSSKKLEQKNILKKKRREEEEEGGGGWPMTNPLLGVARDHYLECHTTTSKLKSN
jgi:hypothetical protein